MKMILILCCFFTLQLTITNGYDGEKISLPPCDYTALYNFGDSNSDTGGISAAFRPIESPNGETYFHRPAGRPSDGRLTIDFIADYLGIPYLSPYLDSIGTNFRRGANFATGGATVLKPNQSFTASGLSPFPLEAQVDQYTQLISRSAYIYNQTKDECVRKTLPIPELHSSKALFTIDIGQNDVTLGVRDLSYELQRDNVLKIVDVLVSQVEVLYERGARTFWIHNTGPIGCLPLVMTLSRPPKSGDLDEVGCVKVQNEVALLFNKVLKEGIVNLRSKLSFAAIVYVDVYAAKYELIRDAKIQGFESPFTICCGYVGTGYYVKCGSKGVVNGTEVTAGSCADPSKVISWDGVHYSEAANKWVAARIANGSLSDPAAGVTRACHK